MPDNDQKNVGQGRQYNDVASKHDAEHGEFHGNVPRTGQPPNLPNIGPAGPDPSPFKVGQ